MLVFFFRSICLLIQATLPVLLFADGPVHLTLKGGTNADMAPQVDYFTWVRGCSFKTQLDGHV